MQKRFILGLSMFFAALFIPQLAVAQEALLPDAVETPPPSTTPVAPPPFWEGLDGRASLSGGEITTSRGQYEYAQRMSIPVITTSDRDAHIASGYLVRLEGQNISLKSGDVVPFVLPETRDFILHLAQDYGQAGCSALIITSALRVVDGDMPSNASSFSVHPRGMAADVRVTGISEYCETWLNDYLLTKESQMVVDATREHWRMVRGRRVPNPHFHIVVPITPIRTSVQLAQNP